jgi:hypothetical protein
MSLRSVQSTTINLPQGLHTRAKALAKKLHMGLSDLIRDGLWDKCSALEERLRNEERLRHETEQRDKKRRTVALVDASDLSPRETSLSPSNAPPKAHVDDDDLPEEVYQQYVEGIFAVTDPVERRMAAQVAIKTIREYHPLTAPDDCTIERRLNELLTVKMRESPPPVAPAIQPLSASPTNGETSTNEESSVLKRVFDGFLPKQIAPTSMNNPAARRGSNDR